MAPWSLFDFSTSAKGEGRSQGGLLSRNVMHVIENHVHYGLTPAQSMEVTRWVDARPGWIVPGGQGDTETARGVRKNLALEASERFGYLTRNDAEAFVHDLLQEDANYPRY